MTAIVNFSCVYFENAAALSYRMKIPILDELKANHTIILFASAICPKRCLEFALKNPVKYIILNGENIISRFYDKNDNDGKYYLYLQKHYPTFHYSPYTASKCLEIHGLKSAGLFNWEFVPRKNIGGIDLLFYGFPSPERESVEKMIKIKYPNKNIVFAYCIYNEKLIPLLIQAKYVLNIPFCQESALETHRIEQALACGAKVISKRSSCDYLNKEYKSKIIFIDDYYKIELD
jgi:hypothetical protein